MPDSVILRPLGRISEPSSTVAPPGSLLRAQNCVLRSPGVLAPVADLTELSDASGPTGRGVWQVSPQFDNGAVPEQLCHVSNGISAQNGVRKTSAMGTEIQYPDPDGSAVSVEYFDHGDGLTMYPMYQARDAIYLCDQRGLLKWENTDATELKVVRDFPIKIDSASGTGTFLGASMHVNYQAIARFRDANGLETRSAPSVVEEFNNGGGGAVGVDVTLSIRESLADAMAFEAIELYRTRQLGSAVTLPNEYYLAFEVPLADFSTAGTGGSSIYTVTVTDDVQDSELPGAASYTSTSQGGAEAINIAPPEHLYHAEFRSHQFWGNVAEKEFFPELGYTSGSFSHNMTNCDTVVGTPTITVNGVLDSAEPGMMLTPAENFPDDAYIVSITGAGPYTVTMSDNATSSLSGVTITAVDTAYLLWGDGTADRIAFSSIRGGFIVTFGSDVATLTTHLFPGNTTQGGFDNVAQFSSIHRTARQGQAQMWISSTVDASGSADWADLGATDGTPTTGGTPALPALHRRRLYWSKHQEPEHTTLGNFVDLSTEIVGLGALEDALIILCKGGVHRLTGDNGNWRVDPIDTSVDIIGGRSTAVAWNRVYTLGNRGLLEITSGGVRNVTDDIAADWFREADWDDARIEDVRQYMVNNDGYHPPTLFAAADPTHREYVLMCEGTDSPLGDGVTSEMLVYNAGTQAFTTWALDEDGAFAISVLGYARGDYSTLTADQAPGIVVGRQYSSGDTSAALHLLDERQVARVNGYSQFTQDIAFREMHEGDPTHMKVWTSIVWETDGNGEIAAAVFQEDEGGGQVTQAPTYAGREYRLWPPRSVKRSTQLVCGLQCTGVTVFALRATFSSGGREVPL